MPRARSGNALVILLGMWAGTTAGEATKQPEGKQRHRDETHDPADGFSDAFSALVAGSRSG